MYQSHLKILILCNGDGTRWGNYMGLPKQLAPLNQVDESLIERTIRMCCEHGISLEAIYIISADDRLKKLPTNYLTPRVGSLITETLLETQRLWSGHTVVLLGDVFYSTQSLKRILGNSQELAIYGRKGQSNYTYTPHGEIFALSFSQSKQPTVLDHLNKAIADAQSGGRGKLWEFYRSTVNIPLDKHRFAGNHFVDINDWTDDFDWPSEYDQNMTICEQIEKAGLLQKLMHRVKIRLEKRSIRRKKRLTKRNKAAEKEETQKDTK